jgi:hypothetical protein
VPDLRLFLCVRDACRRPVLVCRRCDHGNIYCGTACRDAQRAVARRVVAQQLDGFDLDA